jgi:hypothetical protein
MGVGEDGLIMLTAGDQLKVLVGLALANNCTLSRLHIEVSV